MDENGVPTQEEVDAVAYFVEAATELSNSAFILEEFQLLSFSPAESNGGDDGATFPDPDIVKSALVPFRRMWHQGEPCYFRRVANILYKYHEYTRHFLKPLAFDDDQSLTKLMWLGDSELSPTDVINLWLNTKYHHVGKSQTAGKFTREDFERYENEIGEVKFEFVFLSAVNEVTVFIRNILGCANQFLDSIEKDPSFEITTAAPQEGIVRATPGITHDQLSPEKKVWRLRRRGKFDAVDKLLEMADSSDLSVASVLSANTTLDEMLTDLNIVLESCDDFQAAMETGGLCKMGGSVDPRIWRGDHARRGFVGRHQDGRVFHGEEFMDIVRDQFPGFRDAFLRDPFV